MKTLFLLSLFNLNYSCIITEQKLDNNDPNVSIIDGFGNTNPPNVTISIGKTDNAPDCNINNQGVGSNDTSSDSENSNSIINPSQTPY